MRRALALIALTALAVVATGCSGRDAQEAQTILAQSQAAVAEVRSATFTAKLWIEGGPQEVSFSMTGGGYSKGKQAGDFYVIIDSGGGIPGFERIVMVQRDGKVSASMGGTVMSDVVPPTPPEQSVGIISLEPYVKDVQVEHGKVVDGESTTKITGVVDTAALVKGALGSFSGMAGLGETGFDIGETFGDTRAVFYVSDRTHLPLRALVDVPMDILGEEVVMHMDFAYTSFDRKLSFPDLR